MCPKLPLRKVLGFIESAKRDGAKLLTGACATACDMETGALVCVLCICVYPCVYAVVPFAPSIQYPPVGGNRVGSKGYYVEPTVFSDVTDTMEVFREEVFGPVMTITKFSTAEEVEVLAVGGSASVYFC